MKIHGENTDQEQAASALLSADISSVGIVGGGTMGRGIAMAFADAGIPAVIVETDQESAMRAKALIADTYRRSIARGSLDEAEMNARLAGITTGGDYSLLSPTDLIIEAAYEEMGVKHLIFKQLEGVARRNAILATNTSYLDIDEIASVIGTPERVAGMHFFSPANVMKLVEVVRGKNSSPAVIDTLLDISRKIAKIPVVVGNCYGFVGNRMLNRRSEQVDRLLLEGASPARIDSALTAFGFRMGPCAASDLAGLDISWRMRRATGRSAPAADALVEAGRLGQKSGRGYYSYELDPRRPAVDPEATTIIEKAASELGIVRRVIETDEILDRVLLPMINEAARILEEGIAESPSDIDLVWVNGYGFPASRGGPMHYAQERGFANVAERLEELSRSTGDPSLLPASLLRRAAETGTFPRTGSHIDG